MARRICIVTGTRAEYGLLVWLMREIEADPVLQLQIVATGTHLSPEFGRTYQQIEADGFKIDRKLEMLLSSDTGVGTAKSAGLAIVGFADIFDELQPDIVVVLGDRFELLAAATTALLLRIPLAHLAGGDTTEGAFDEAIRHAVTKMAHIHFPFSETARKRLLQLGENPKAVFNFGSTGIDGIVNQPLLSQADLEKSLNFKFGARNLLATFHPVTLEPGTAEQSFAALLAALDGVPEINVIFTKANADPEGLRINEMIDSYVSKHPNRTIAFASLGQKRYLSVLRCVDAVIGNSSSGLLEAPSFKIGTINIGDRQKGREKPESVLDCPANVAAISGTLKSLYSADFQKKLLHVKNPYGDGGASKRIKDVLKTVDLKGIVKKHFFEMHDE